jgi:hypothetical protein
VEIHAGYPRFRSRALSRPGGYQRACGGARAYAVFLDDEHLSRAYQERHAFPVPSVRFPDRRYIRLYRASLVPQTLVVDGEGRVLYSRPGVVDRATTVDSILLAAGTTARRSVPPEEGAAYRPGGASPPS